MSDPTLFPAPQIPTEALPAIQHAATSARMARASFTDALYRRGETQWSAEAIQEIGRLLRASKEIHEAAEALLAANKRP